jgi:hypothetical protein
MRIFEKNNSKIWPKYNVFQPWTKGCFICSKRDKCYAKRNTCNLFVGTAKKRRMYSRDIAGFQQNTKLHLNLRQGYIVTKTPSVRKKLFSVTKSGKFYSSNKLIILISAGNNSYNIQSFKHTSHSVSPMCFTDHPLTTPPALLMLIVVIFQRVICYIVGSSPQFRIHIDP